MSWKIKKLPVSGFAANCYWIENGKEAWLIDPAAWPEKRPHSDAVLQGIIVTHGHMDHIMTADDWRDKYDVPLIIHEADAHMLTDSMANVSAMFGRPMSWRRAEKTLKDEDLIKLDQKGAVLRVMNTPGHTRGGICLLLIDEKQTSIAMFTGDTIFSDSVGRTDLGGSDDELRASVDKIRHMLTKDNYDMKIYPGHGPEIQFDELCQKHPWMNRHGSDFI